MADMVAAQRVLNGDHWSDWLAETAATCPALLVRGRRSGVLGAARAREMVSARPGARLVERDAGHTVRATDPVGFAESVRGFLAGAGEFLAGTGEPAGGGAACPREVGDRAPARGGFRAPS